jgi:hypothetical protein
LSRAKHIRRMYMTHYRTMSSGIETSSYFADKLFHNYIYKGSSVSIQVSIDLKKHNNYSEIIKLLPDEGQVLVLGSGMGAFPLLLSMVKPALSIDAVESDEDKLALARNCASCTENISYIESDPLYFEIRKTYNTVILVDCLSKFEKTVQQQILRNCLNHSSLVLLSDIDYNWQNIIRLKLSGTELQKNIKYNLSELEQLSEGLCFSLNRNDDIFAFSKKE